jgi:hypothetical protein
LREPEADVREVFIAVIDHLVKGVPAAAREIAVAIATARAGSDNYRATVTIQRSRG